MPKCALEKEAEGKISYGFLGLQMCRLMWKEDVMELRMKEHM